MGIEISGLPAATTVGATDVFVVVQSGVTKQVPFSVITTGPTFSGNVGVGQAAADYGPGLNTFSVGGSGNANIDLVAGGTVRVSMAASPTQFAIAATAIDAYFGTDTGKSVFLYTDFGNVIEMAPDGTVTIPKLAGAGSRAVVASAAGVLSAP